MPGRDRNSYVWVLLSLAGAGLGYFYMAGWCLANREAFDGGKLFQTLALGVILVPVLAWVWSLVWGWILRRPWRLVFAQLAVPLILLPLFFALPWAPLREPGVWGLALFLCLLAGAVCAGLHPDIKAPLLALIVILSVASLGYCESCTVYYDRASLERILAGNADAPLRYRLLIPWLSQGLSALFQSGLKDTGFLLRTFIVLLIFLVSPRVMARWVKGPLIWAAPFMHMALLSFSNTWRYTSGEAEILGVWLLIWALAARRHLWALLVMLLFCLNRETLILLGPWYLLCALLAEGWSIKNRVWWVAGAMIIGVFTEQFALILAYGLDFQAADYLSKENFHLLRNWLAWLGPDRSYFLWKEGLGLLLSFMGGAWLVAVLFWRRLPLELRWGVIVNLPFLLLVQTFLGRYLESRQLLLLSPFVIGACLCLVQDSVAQDDKRS